MIKKINGPFDEPLFEEVTPLEKKTDEKGINTDFIFAFFHEYGALLIKILLFCIGLMMLSVCLSALYPALPLTFLLPLAMMLPEETLIPGAILGGVMMALPLILSAIQYFQKPPDDPENLKLSSSEFRI